MTSEHNYPQAATPLRGGLYYQVYICALHMQYVMSRVWGLVVV